MHAECLVKRIHDLDFDRLVLRLGKVRNCEREYAECGKELGSKHKGASEAADVAAPTKSIRASLWFKDGEYTFLPWSRPPLKSAF